MAINNNCRFDPDYGVPPGDTLIEVLKTCGMTQADLAARSGRPLKTINEIAKGKAAITPETSLQFEKVLGVPASFWNSLESNFQHFRAKQREGERLKSYVNWLKELPIKNSSREVVCGLHRIQQTWYRKRSGSLGLLIQLYGGIFGLIQRRHFIDHERLQLLQAQWPHGCALASWKARR